MTAADNIVWGTTTENWNRNSVKWNYDTNCFTLINSKEERLKVLEEAIMVLADIMKRGVSDSRTKMFLDIVDGLREKEDKEEIEDCIDSELFEINDDF